MMNKAQVYASAVLLGAVAGMRSFTAPAVVSRILRPSGARNGYKESLASDALHFLSHRQASKTALILALGEAVADKLPFTPARTNLGPLGFRAISGAISAASVCRANGSSALLCAVLGATAAAGATFAAYAGRKQIGRTLHLPDFVIALGEDALVATASQRLLRTVSA